MLDLLNLTWPELLAFVTGPLGEKPFRAAQLWQWIWGRGARSFAGMSDISRALRSRLEQAAFISRPEIELEQCAEDGAIKLLLRLADGELIESVLIPEGDRVTQCLSSQAGCVMGCSFCATGSLGFKRNLTQAEILGQALLGRERLGGPPGRSPLRNLVFMGMGEPLLNLDNLLRCLETLHSAQGLRFSRRRLTVSTCGLPGGLLRLGRSGLASLALSLHAVSQETRARIMPKAAALWDLEEMLEEVAACPQAPREYVTLEYLLLRDVNDSPAEARALARIAARLKAKINLIAYNPAPGASYAAPEPERALAFEQELWRRGLTAVLRKSRGRDIQAACGQLCCAAARRQPA